MWCVKLCPSWDSCLDSLASWIGRSEALFCLGYLSGQCSEIEMEIEIERESLRLTWTIPSLGGCVVEKNLARTYCMMEITLQRLYQFLRLHLLPISVYNSPRSTGGSNSVPSNMSTSNDTRRSPVTSSHASYSGSGSWYRTPCLYLGGARDHNKR